MIQVMRPIINSVKNIADGVLLGLGATVVTDSTIALAVNDYTGGNTDVPTGSVVKSIYIFVQIISTGTGTANCDFYIAKCPANVRNSLPDPGSTGGAAQRKFILHEEKGIPGNSSDGAYPLTFKGVVKIPRGRQRMAEGDVIVLITRGTDAHNVCFKSIYKFYT